MTRQPRYNRFERVDPREWNMHDRSKLVEPVIVLLVREARCESGFMVTVEDAKGTRKELDENWLRPIKKAKGKRYYSKR